MEMTTTSALIPGREFVAMSAKTGGCGLGTCNCSPGHWLSVGNGDITIQVHFPSRRAMMRALKGV